MPDPRFFVTASPVSVVQAADLCDAIHVEGSRTDTIIDRVCGMQHTDRAGAAMFIKGASYFPAILENPPAACLIPDSLAEDALEAGLGEVTGLLACKRNARLSFALLAGAMHQSMMDLPALPDDLPSARIAETASVAPSAIVSPGAVIGERTIIGAMVFVGPGVEIGADCLIGTSVTITHTLMGDRCKVLSGARIGESGFGFVADGRTQYGVAQLGRVILGDEVEIGANTTVDRGALADTRIGKNSKIDNLVQIAHNVVIGESCVLAGMCGISGSCVIGDGAMLGGQAVLGDHVTVGKDARVYARSALMHNVPDGEVWAGMPAKPARQYFKEIAVLGKLAKNSGKKNAE